MFLFYANIKREIATHIENQTFSRFVYDLYTSTRATKYNKEHISLRLYETRLILISA